MQQIFLQGDLEKKNALIKLLTEMFKYLPESMNKFGMPNPQSEDSFPRNSN